MSTLTLPDASGLAPLVLPFGMESQAHAFGSERSQPAPKAIARFQAAMAEQTTAGTDSMPTTFDIGRAGISETPSTDIKRTKTAPSQIGAAIHLSHDFRQTPDAKQVQLQATGIQMQPTDVPLPVAADAATATDATSVTSIDDIRRRGCLDTPSTDAARPEVAPYQADIGITRGLDIQQTTDDKQVRQTTDGIPTQQPTNDIPATQPAANIPTLQPTNGIPATQPTANIPTLQPTNGIPATQPAANIPTLQPTNDIPATQPTTNIPVQQPTATLQSQQPTEGAQLANEATTASVAATPTDNRQQVTRTDPEQSVRGPVRSIRQTTDDKQVLLATDNVTAPLQAAPVVVPVAPDAAPTAVTSVVSIEIDPAAATAKTRELVDAAAQVADTILVTPSLVSGEGEITIQLKPNVLDGSEIRLEAKGTTITVAITPATPSIAQVIAQSQAQFEQTLVERLPSFQIAVTVAPTKSIRRNESAT